MPNHDTNYCVFIGTEEKIKTFREAVIRPMTEGDGEYFDFNAIVAQPPNIEVGGCTGHHEPGVVCWYEWNREHWGTKWSAYSFDSDSVVECDYSEGRLLYLTFDTAWGPPTPIFAAIEEKFGLQVHVHTEDEGGFEMPEYGEPERFLEITKTRLVYDESIGKYGDERPATDADDEDEVYHRVTVDLAERFRMTTPVPIERSAT